MIQIEPLETRDNKGQPTGKYKLVAYAPESPESCCIDCCDHEHDSKLEASECQDALLMVRQLESKAKGKEETGFQERALAFSVQFMMSRSESYKRAADNMLASSPGTYTREQIEAQLSASEILGVAAGIVDQELKQIVQQNNQAAIANLIGKPIHETEANLPSVPESSH